MKSDEMSSSEREPLHFILFPFMAQGHMIPMVDIGRLLAKRGAVITIITTPLNAARFEQSLARAATAGLAITVVQLRLPLTEAGFPEGCENVDTLPSFQQGLKFSQVVNSQVDQVEELLKELKPRPSCIISDMCLYYTCKLAKKFQIPRIYFHGFCCFTLLCVHNIRQAKIIDRVEWNSEYFTVPGLPEKVDLKVNQLPFVAEEGTELKQMYDRRQEAEEASYGVIVNTFQQLEPEYVNLYKKAKRDKVWCFGPVSLSHEDNLDKAQRGNKASIDEDECLRWLDGQEKATVLYACLGSLSRMTHYQLTEIGLGLEASKTPFVWAVTDTHERNQEFEKWKSEEKFEERMKGRGLLIRGWAPQLLILSHPAIGGFLTHCGWNSTMEGISSGIPLITWPLFGDQFCNEKLIVQVLKIGVSIGVEDPNGKDEENPALLVKKERVRDAVKKLMDGGEEEGEKRRTRAKEFAEMAKKAVSVGGSSHSDITLFIEDIMQMSSKFSTEPQI